MQENILLSYTEYLKKEEKSPATAQKYLRAAEKFMDFLKNRELNRAEMLVYKEKLSKQLLKHTAEVWQCPVQTAVTACRVRQKWRSRAFSVYTISTS